jgi:hypothetical protein
MVRMLLERQLDMVVATRVTDEQAAYRSGHRFGNAMFTGIVRHVFGKRITDALSGYRAFSRRFAKSFPTLTATGFDVEAGFSIHALELKLPIGELPTPYRARPEGSVSKLRTYTDGLHILGEIFLLIRDERPLQFFGIAGLALLSAAFGLGIPVVLEFVQIGLVPRLPTAILATGLVVLAFLSFGCGLVLDSVARGRKESKRLAYLAIPGVFALDPRDGVARR